MNVLKLLRINYRDDGVCVFRSNEASFCGFMAFTPNVIEKCSSGFKRNCLKDVFFFLLEFRLGQIVTIYFSY